jgi:hypothetical protein
MASIVRQADIEAPAASASVGPPGLHRGTARPENGRRHYLYPDLAGLALPGDRN